MQAALAKFKRYLETRYPDRSTTKHYMSDLAIFSQFVDHQSPETITSQQLNAFVQAQREQGLQAATINRRLSAISSFYEFLIGEQADEVLQNPVIWKRHSVRLGRHLPRDVSDAVVEQLLAVVDHPRDRAMLALMSGARGPAWGWPRCLALSSSIKVTFGFTANRARGPRLRFTCR